MKPKHQNQGKFVKKQDFKSKNAYQKPKKDVVPQKPKKAEMIRRQKIAEAKAAREQFKAEKDARVKEYKKKRLEKTKAISKKTKRGQPLMKDRIQLLLKQIEASKRS